MLPSFPSHPSLAPPPPPPPRPSPPFRFLESGCNTPAKTCTSVPLLTSLTQSSLPLVTGRDHFIHLARALLASLKTPNCRTRASTHVIVPLATPRLDQPEASDRPLSRCRSNCLAFVAPRLPGLC